MILKEKKERISSSFRRRKKEEAKYLLEKNKNERNIKEKKWTGIKVKWKIKIERKMKDYWRERNIVTKKNE